MRYVKHNIMKQKPKAILIDSSNLLHRAAWIGKNVRTNVNPAYIFLTSVRKYVNKFECNNVFSVWDKRLVRGVKNYRRLAKTIEYKGTRDSAKNEEVFSHEDLTTRLLDALGVKNMYPGILEADDVISWLCDRIDQPKVIVSVDQDMLQLIDENTIVYSPIKDIIISLDNFESVTGCPRDQFLRYKSMIGDKSDNLPGIVKCGPKTARKYIDNYPDDVMLKKNIDHVKLEPYFTNLKMIDLKQGHKEHPDDPVIYSEQYETVQDQTHDIEEFKRICEEHNINNITKEISSWKNAFAPEVVNNTLASIVNSLGLDK